MKSPIAEVGIPDDVVPCEVEKAGEGVADDGRAEMTDVHRLRHIGAGIVDDHCRWFGGHGEAEVIVGCCGSRPRGKRPVRQSEIDEARTGNINRLELFVSGDPVDDILGYLPGARNR